LKNCTCAYPRRQSTPQVTQSLREPLIPDASSNAKVAKFAANGTRA
jgi:hypothetical protein